MIQSDFFHDASFLNLRGLARMDRGIAMAQDAEERVQPEYGDALFQCICDVAVAQELVHIDDILIRFSRRPHHPNANAAPWRRAKAEGVLALSDRPGRRCTVDAGKNAHVYPVYRSLIFKRTA